MQQVVLSLKSIISPKHNEEVSSIIRVENMKELSKESFSYPMSVDNEFDDLIISDFMITAQYIFFLGFLYYSGIIVEKNIDEAFKLFSKASNYDYPMAQVYLSKCYQTAGIGIEINSALAITCLHNAIKNDSICGQLYLGILYEDGIGSDVDLNKALYWYEKAANNGNLKGLYHLGNCYQFGKGIEK